MIVVNDILTTDIDFNDTYVAIGNFDGVHYGHYLSWQSSEPCRQQGSCRTSAHQTFLLGQVGSFRKTVLQTAHTYKYNS